MTMHRPVPEGFIPTQENKFYLLFFKWYVRGLFGRRFSRVWLKKSYMPAAGQSTLYFLNHHSWWDGLIPLLLNDFVFYQRARAIMEDKQMREYGFFSKIGAFSIDRNNPRSALFSLDYASDWLNEPGNSIYLYPEGTITTPCTPLRFESGILRIRLNSPEADVVPIALVISHRRSDKPELFVHVGKPTLSVGPNPTKAEQLDYLQQSLRVIVDQTGEDALSGDHGYQRLI